MPGYANVEMDVASLTSIESHASLLKEFFRMYDLK